MERLRVLFLCTGNSARSQIAEGLLRKLSRGRADVFSAGTKPEADVHPLATDVLRTRFHVDTDDLYPKHLDRFVGQTFHYVIMVCDRAAEVCPTFPGDPEALRGFTGASRILLRSKTWKRSGAPSSASRTAWQRECESGWRSLAFIVGLTPPENETCGTDAIGAQIRCK